MTCTEGSSDSDELVIAISQRMIDIVEYLMGTEILASVKNLSDKFGVSESTIRRDLRDLVKLGYVSVLGEGREKRYYRSSGMPIDRIII